MYFTSCVSKYLYFLLLVINYKRGTGPLIQSEQSGNIRVEKKKLELDSGRDQLHQVVQYTLQIPLL